MYCVKRAGQASDRRCHLSSVPGGTKGDCILQEEPVGELEEPGDVLDELEHHEDEVRMNSSAQCSSSSKSTARAGGFVQGQSGTDSAFETSSVSM